MIQVYHQQQTQKDPSGASLTLKTLKENLALSPILDIQILYKQIDFIDIIKVFHMDLKLLLLELGKVSIQVVYVQIENQKKDLNFQSDCQSLSYNQRQKFQYWKGLVEFAKKWNW